MITSAGAVAASAGAEATEGATLTGGPTTLLGMFTAKEGP